MRPLINDYYSYKQDKGSLCGQEPVATLSDFSLSDVHLYCRPSQKFLYYLCFLEAPKLVGHSCFLSTDKVKAFYKYWQPLNHLLDNNIRSDHFGSEVALYNSFRQKFAVIILWVLHQPFLSVFFRDKWDLDSFLICGISLFRYILRHLQCPLDKLWSLFYSYYYLYHISEDRSRERKGVMLAWNG